MRALRIDLGFDALTEGRTEELRGNDVLNPSIRFEGELPSGGSKVIPIPTKKTNTLVFRNDSSVPITIVVRNASDDIVQSIYVTIATDALIPIARSGTTIEFINPDPFPSQVTALFF